MKRAAILTALSGAALLFVACTNDFDGLFANGAPPDDFEPKVKPPEETSSGSTGGGSSSSGDSSECPTTKIGCNAGTGGVASNDPVTCGCELSCAGGTVCSGQACSQEFCRIDTESAVSDTTCTAQECELKCLGTSKCTLDCSGALSCSAKCEGTYCKVFCPKGECEVSCGKGVSPTPCDDGSFVCGGDCKNIKG